MIKFEKNIFGYIEGYYGNILDWKSRKRIIKKMNSLGLNSYFYAPKFYQDCIGEKIILNLGKIILKTFVRSQMRIILK